MSPGGYEIGISGSASSASKLSGQFGGGDDYITTGGGKQTQTLYIIVGVVAVVVAILFLRK
jgi:hypothetical protein